MKSKTGWVLLCSAWLGSIFAQNALTKEQVLDRWASALGGREKLLKGSVETGGMKGTFERWTTSSGEFRMALDIAGAIRQVSIFDGRAGWAMDTSL